jgi:hypothetical protein
MGRIRDAAGVGLVGLALLGFAGCAEDNNSASKITGVTPATGGPTDSSGSSYEAYSKGLTGGTAGGYAGKTSGSRDPSKTANSMPEGSATKSADPDSGEESK